MAEDSPKLRLVDPDERAPEPNVEPGAAATPPPPPLTDDDGHPMAWMSAAIPLCIGIAILVVGLAVALRLLMDTDRDDSADDTTSVTVPARSGTTAVVDPFSVISTIAPTTTAVPSTTVSTAAAPTTVARNVDPGLIALPVAGGAPAAPGTPPPPPTTGSARIRIFNGFSLDEGPLEVWEISGPTPVRYGSVPYAGLVEMVAQGRLLPSGVSLQLRFVRPGGDPMGAIQEGVSSRTGPWGRNFTPADGSSVTLMLNRNPGLGVVPIDNVRALGSVQPGRVHIVPVVRHLVLEGTRTKQWAADGVGCLGVLSTDKDRELDVAVGTALRLASADDPTCSHTITDALVVGESTAVAVVGLEIPGDRARLIAVPLR